MIQSLSSMLSGFLVSFVENWKITLVMMAAGPVLVAVQGITDKVRQSVDPPDVDLFPMTLTGICVDMTEGLNTVMKFTDKRYSMENAHERFTHELQCIN